MTTAWRVALLLWFPIAVAIFGACNVLALIPTALVWVATGDSERTWRIFTWGHPVWWGVTNRLADRASSLPV